MKSECFGHDVRYDNAIYLVLVRLGIDDCPMGRAKVIEVLSLEVVLHRRIKNQRSPAAYFLILDNPMLVSFIIDIAQRRSKAVLSRPERAQSARSPGSHSAKLRPQEVIAVRDSDPPSHRPAAVCVD